MLILIPTFGLKKLKQFVFFENWHTHTHTQTHAPSHIDTHTNTHTHTHTHTHTEYLEDVDSYFDISYLKF